MSNPNDLTDDDREFADAFNSDGASAGEAAAEDKAAEQTAEAVEQVGGAEDAGAEGGAAVAPAAQEPAQEAQRTVTALTPEDIEREMQRLRSWEGRLKAQEQKLKSAQPASTGEREQNEDEGHEVLEEVTGAAKVAGKQELAAATAAASEAIEAGEISPEDAVKQLADDFGDEFVTMIKKIVVATARQAVEPVAQDINQVRAVMSEREHFAAIAAKHPDVREIAASPELQKYIGSLQGDAKAKAEAAYKQGSVDEVVSLLDAYKAAKQQMQPVESGPAKADTSNDDAMDSLEGVRSGGVRLPEKPPAAEDDYAGAWASF